MPPVLRTFLTLVLRVFINSYVARRSVARRSLYTVNEIKMVGAPSTDCSAMQLHVFRRRRFSLIFFCVLKASSFVQVSLHILQAHGPDYV